MENKFGKKSILNLSTISKDGRSILDDVYYTAPFKIMSPFNCNNDILKVMVLSVSAGIMEGDTQEMNINIGENTYLEIMSQSYEKIHKMNGGHATREAKLEVKRNGTLIYNMLPTIPFADSSFSNKVSIELEDESSKVIYIDVLSSGRVASGESFKYSLYKNLVEIRESGNLIYRDNCLYRPNDIEMSEIGMYEEYTHCATMIMCNYNVNKESVELIREMFSTDKNFIGGITETGHGDTVVRLLGFNSDELIEQLEKITSLIKNYLPIMYL